MNISKECPPLQVGDGLVIEYPDDFPKSVVVISINKESREFDAADSFGALYYSALPYQVRHLWRGGLLIWSYGERSLLKELRDLCNDLGQS